MSEPCYFISAGELRAIIGDDTDHGAGQDQHSGVWFLTSIKDGHTLCPRETGCCFSVTIGENGPRCGG